MDKIRISYAGRELSLEEKCNSVIENCETFSVLTIFEKEKEVIDKIKADHFDKIIVTEDRDENGELYYCFVFSEAKFFRHGQEQRQYIL